MSAQDNSLRMLMEIIQRKAPEYLDLLSATCDAEFETAFDAFLERAVSQLEASKSLLNTLDEDGLSSVLCMALSMPGLSVTRESHSNGHVDITVVADHCSPIRKKLGEAKIYSGPAYHLKGLDQLLRRYTTGREGRGILVTYVRKENIAGLVKKLREAMDTELPLHQQGPTLDHGIRWWFLSRHAHSSGENLEVSHVGCNLHVESTVEPGA